MEYRSHENLGCHHRLVIEWLHALMGASQEISRLCWGKKRTLEGTMTQVAESEQLCCHKLEENSQAPSASLRVLAGSHSSSCRAPPTRILVHCWERSM